MLYKKETPFDKLSFECLLLLENRLREGDPCFLGFGLAQETRKEIIESLKWKINARSDKYFSLESYGIVE